MAYSGKVSRGCETCRKRRIKCDSARPTCGQCRKSNRTCHGYRDLSEVIFRNQGVANPPTRKARGHSPKSSGESTSSSSSSSPGPQHTPSRDSTPPVPATISRSVEDQALAFYFAEYVQTTNGSSLYRSYHEILLPLYLQAQAGSTLFAVTSAISLLTFSQRKGDKQLQRKSRAAYGAAVAALRGSLEDAATARSDDALMTTMMLSYYDAIVADSWETLHSWRHHADGAFTLLRLRSREDLRSPFARKLYWAIYTSSVIGHINRGEAIFPFTDWTQLWTTPEPPKAPVSYASLLMMMLMRLPALRHAATYVLPRPMNADQALQVLKIMANAKLLDEEISRWPFQVPAEGACRLAGWQVDIPNGDINSMPCYPGPIFEYNYHWIVNTWNLYHAARIICQSIVVNCLERLVPPAHLSACDEHRSAQSTIQRMIDSLSASAPYCLGDRKFSTEVDPSSDFLSSADPVLPDASFLSLNAGSFSETFFQSPASGAPPLQSSTTLPMRPGSRAETTIPVMTGTAGTQDLSSLISQAQQALVPLPPKNNPLTKVTWSSQPLSGFHLIWTAFVGSSVASAPLRQRLWLAGRIAEVGKRFGIGLASLSAQIARHNIAQGETQTITHRNVPPYTPYPSLVNLLALDRLTSSSSDAPPNPTGSQQARYEALLGSMAERMDAQQGEAFPGDSLKFA